MRLVPGRRIRIAKDISEIDEVLKLRTRNP
jgi:hypothetical protein